MENLRENPQISLVPSDWSEDAAAWLDRARQDATLAELRHQVEVEGARLFRVEVAGELVGAFVLRVDHGEAGSEGVIVAAAAHYPGYDLTAGLLPHIELLFSGVASYRVHTALPAVARKFTRQGYQPAEIVLRKKIQ